ncbi:hypothetical protein GUITHDRAFT_109455 [Guillardia theta CCMP2712]|uniref:UBA domain-containing protein n=1 Tax=Guillardia theta (strain CCMP2712) TaxID=905079 RepID=L1J8L5_GUITC|nr:hypothetical protein GUITHDRAFT_109455 [Guillardia theta CCMP2712]EKX44677.1 hypothetical protein GUITHDRAFT_109455 [Guillardia theta CCMP2712]|eukprot:XP_005831657.1 hypothetical protein GUITHDRAFT_109455 [Guillardia theta CCMP2712]
MVLYSYRVKKEWRGAMEIFSEGKIHMIKEMGFTDEGIIKDALRQVSGNVALAIEKLVSGAVARPSVTVVKENEDAPPPSSSCTKSLAPIFTASQKPSLLSQPSQRGRAPVKEKPGRMGKSSSRLVKSSSMVSFPTMSRELSRSAVIKREREPEEEVNVMSDVKAGDVEVHVLPEEQEQEDREDQVPKRRRPADFERRPLAERMRPESVERIVGQRDVANAIRKFLLTGSIPSIILWGPPGCGKSTLGKIVSRAEGFTSVFLSAVNSGLADDAFLPHVESGLITLIGATTENPSFSLNRALLSRCQVYNLKKLDEEEVKDIILRALNDRENGLMPGLDKLRGGQGSDRCLTSCTGDFAMKQRACRSLRPSRWKFVLVLVPQALDVVVKLADGDARSALNFVEVSMSHAMERSRSSEERGGRDAGRARGGAGGAAGAGAEVDEEGLDDVRKATLDQMTVAYDAHGDEHYNCISAFHKSIRGSDPQATIYWLARMLEGGENPEYVARRMIRIASEDIGLADTSALVQATATLEAVKAIGMPECNLALCQCAVYLACCPKCNALYSAYKAAAACVREEPNYPVPLHLRNATSKVLADLGWGKGYKYNHDYPEGCDQEYLPPELAGRRFLTVEPARRREVSPAL